MQKELSNEMQTLFSRGKIKSALSVVDFPFELSFELDSLGFESWPIGGSGFPLTILVNSSSEKFFILSSLSSFSFSSDNSFS